MPQAIILCTVLTFGLLAIAIFVLLCNQIQRQKLESELRQAKAELELRVRDSTAQLIEANRQLQSSEQQFRRAVLYSPLPVMLYAEDGEVLQISRAWTAITGYELAEIPNLANWMELAYGDRNVSVREIIDNLWGMDTRVEEGESTIRTRSGETRIWEFFSAPLGRTHDGRRVAITTAVDITERLQAEMVVQASQAKLNDVLNTAIASIVCFHLFPDCNWEYEYQSPGCELLFGYTVEEMMADNYLWMSRVLPEDRENVIMPLCEDMFAERTTSAEYRFLHKDGSIRWISVIYASRRDAAAENWIVTGVNHDITERKEMELALQAALGEASLTEAKLSHVLNSAIAVLGTIRIYPNRDWDYVYISPGCERLYGYTIEEVQADKNLIISRIATEDFQRVFIPQFEDIVAERSVTNEFRFRHKNGSLRWISQTLISHTDAVADCWIATTVSIDITARKQAELELQKAKEAAEIANRAKTAFLANMSHELRTPLNAILGFAQIISYSSSLNPEDKEHLDIIHRSGEHLLALINDVLDMAKIDAELITFNPKNFNLLYLLENIKQMFQLQANNQGLQLLLDTSPHLPEYVRTDELKLHQVLINLVSNAIKFTTSGSVTLRVRLGTGDWGAGSRGQGAGGREDKGDKTKFPASERQSVRASLSSSPHFLHFEVEDTGCGIASDEIKSIFQPFVQTQQGKQTQGGTGLGLTISSKFVEILGGELSVSSELGKGSSFRFDIPVTVVKSADTIQELLPQRRVIALAPNQPTYRILIVDDDQNNRLLVQQMLLPLGFAVREAKNGYEAVDIWCDWEPHLIFMDMRMPVMDGYEATKQIKATIKGQATAIIALTAVSFAENRSVVLAIGCDDFISKPFRESDIFEILSRILGVNYIYEDVTLVPPSQETNVLTTEALAALDTNWLKAFHQVTTEGDIQGMLVLIDELDNQHQSVANALVDLVNNFELEKLLSIIEDSEY
jgi:PAS domain S-box-containing protein